MNEIIAAFAGAVVGAFLACLFSIFQRNSDKWKAFQEQVGLIKSRILAIEKEKGIERLVAMHNESINELNSAICRVSPYIFWRCNRRRLKQYFDDYRNAQQHKHSGFQPKPLATIYKEGNAGDCFSDTSSARTYLMELLDEMAGL